MHPTQQQAGITLPDADAIRARINALNAESNRLRRLLRALNRFRAQEPASSGAPQVNGKEFAHAAR